MTAVSISLIRGGRVARQHRRQWQASATQLLAYSITRAGLRIPTGPPPFVSLENDRGAIPYAVA